MMLTDERRASLLAYCKLTEFGDDPEVLALLEGFSLAAEGYLAQAGVLPPPEGTARRAMYDLCVNRLVLDHWDNREAAYVGTVTVDNPVFRRMVNQLKLTEGVRRDGEESAGGGAADGGVLPAGPQGD